MSDPKAVVVEDAKGKIGEGLYNVDSMRNLLTGMGTSRDKTTGSEWFHSGRNADHMTLSARYRESFLDQRAVNTEPDDMTRRWRVFEDSRVQELDKELNIATLVNEVLKWARLYGTAFLYLDIAGAGPSHRPLDISRVRPGSLRGIRVFDRVRMVPVGEVVDDPLHPQYGYPMMYQAVGGTSAMVHHSRVIRFEGTQLPPYERMRNQWFSDSILIPIMDPIDNFYLAFSEAANATTESNIDVLTIPGLTNIMANEAERGKLMERILLWKKMKSQYGVTIIDKKEEWENKKMSLSGLKEMVYEYLHVVASAIGVPATRFLGESPTGLSNSGHLDIVSYADKIASAQSRDIAPRLVKLDKILAASYGLPYEDFRYDWVDAFPETANEREERMTKLTERVLKLLEAGVIDTEEARRMLDSENAIGSKWRTG